MRPCRGASANERLERLLETTFDGDAPAGFQARLTLYAGDTTLPRFGLDSRAWQHVLRTTHIVHLAACTRFDMPLDAIRRHNVDGVAHVLELASATREAGTLRRLAHVSTAYVAGAQGGQVDADALDLDGRFRNTYERSKAEGERLVRQHMASLPITVFRPSIVVGDSRNGEVSGVNTIYWSIKAYLRGMRVLLARADTPIDLVPVDYVCDALLYILQREDSVGHCFLLAGGARTTISLGNLAAQICNYLGTPTPRILPPGLFSLIRVAAKLRCLGTRHLRVIRNTGSYLPYFVSNPTFDTTSTENVLNGSGIEVPPFESYVGRLLDYCLKQGWGKDSPTLRHSRHDAFRSMAASQRTNRIPPRPGGQLST